MLSEYRNLDTKYFQYAHDILRGKIVSNQYIKLACHRYLSWFDREDLYFDSDKVEKKINFVYKMKHWDGMLAGHNFELLPWQHFAFCNIFGWYYRNSNKRVTRNAFIFIARKNGKTAFASAIALACMCKDDEMGCEINLVANSKKQAQIAYDDCSNYSKSLDPKQKYLKVYRDSIKFPKTNSKLQVLASDTMKLDGYRSHAFLLDEFHAQKDWKLYNVMKTSQGSQLNPLAIVITTAGYLQAGYPCFDMREGCISILKGEKVNDGQFSLIYELEDSDNWLDEDCWIKANPSLDTALQRDTVRDYVNEAMMVPSEMFDTMTKQFNRFMSSKDIWITDDIILKNMKHVDLKDFQNQLSYIGVDLAAVSDLAAISIMFPPDQTRKIYPDKFVFKSFAYLPSDCLTKSQNQELYKYWSNNKYLTLTNGNVTDYDEIYKDVQKLNNYLDLVVCYYDQWNSTQFCIQCTNAGIPMFPFSQAVGNFNKPTKEFERLLLQGKVVIDACPITRWCFANSELKIDYNENCKPIKSGGDKSKKIDIVIAMIEALGGYLMEGDLTE